MQAELCSQFEATNVLRPASGSTSPSQRSSRSDCRRSSRALEARCGYSRGQLSADSFTVFAGLSLLAFAYLGGITSISGAIVAGTLAPLGIGFVMLDRAVDMGQYYSLVAGASLVLTAIFNPDGIAGKTRQDVERVQRWVRTVRARRVPAAGALSPEVAHRGL